MGNTFTEPALDDRNIPNSYVIPANLDLSLSQTELLMNLGIQQGVAFQIPVVGPDGDFHVDETDNVSLQMSRIIHRSVFIYPKSIKFTEIGSALNAKFDLSFVYDCGSIAYLSLYFPVKTRFGYRNKYLASRKLGPFRVQIGSGQSFQLSHYGCELTGRDISRYFEEMDYGYHGDEYNASNKDFVVAVVVTNEPGSEERGLIQLVDVDNADISFRSQSINSENDDRLDENYVSSNSQQRSAKSKKYAKMKRSPQREQQRNGVDIEMTTTSNSDKNDTSMESSKHNENDVANNDSNSSNNSNTGNSKLFNLYKNTFKRVQSSSMNRLDDVDSEYCLINISRMLQVSSTTVTVRLRNGMVYSLQDVFDDDRKNDIQMGSPGSDTSNNSPTTVLGSDTSNAQPDKEREKHRHHNKHKSGSSSNYQQHHDTKRKSLDSGTSSTNNDNQNNDKSCESTPCVICLSEPKTVVLFPCRHLCLCSSCAMSLSRQIQTRNGRTETRNKCPMCRQGIIVMVDQ